MQITISAAIVSMLLLSGAWPQDSTKPAVYAVNDAYDVYSFLLPHEQSVRFAKGTLAIQQETVSRPDPPGDTCVSADATKQFKDAIDDYNRLTRKQWLLLRQFQIEKPYELVSSDTIHLTFKEYGATRGWQEFYQRYPDSGGFIVMSPIGFNQAKTLAAVYTGSACGATCGSWRFHLLEKVDGKWKEVPGVTCVTMS